MTAVKWGSSTEMVLSLNSFCMLVFKFFGYVIKLTLVRKSVLLQNSRHLKYINLWLSCFAFLFLNFSAQIKDGGTIVYWGNRPLPGCFLQVNQKYAIQQQFFFLVNWVYLSYHEYLLAIVMNSCFRFCSKDGSVSSSQVIRSFWSSCQSQICQMSM